MHGGLTLITSLIYPPITMSKSTTTAEELGAAFAEAHAAFVDARCDNLAWKHKTLYAIFSGYSSFST